MSTHNPMPQPAIPVREQVQKTFIDTKVLAGFTDHNHLMSIIGEYFSSISIQDQQIIMDNSNRARQYVHTLTPLKVTQTELQQIVHPHINTIINDPVFQSSFANVVYRFAYINPAHVIALQPWIEPRKDKVPTEEAELLRFALPIQWDIPAEINFIPPQGPIQILSSSPMFQNLAIDFDLANGKVQLGPPKHLNLVQVKRFQGKYYLFNGYHRLADAIALGVTEFPCMIIDAFNPIELQLPGPTFFNFSYVTNLPRPPLVSDFLSNATITTKVRERRYGMIVSLDIKQLNIGI
jgi:hypothetical protein